MNRKHPKVEIGQVFGKWTVVAEAPEHEHRRYRRYRRRLLCRCECGRESIVGESELNRGVSKACCICSRRENAVIATSASRKLNVKHRTTELGVETSIAEAARWYGVNRSTAVQRAILGQDPFASRERGRLVINGEVMGPHRAGALVGVPGSTVHGRLRRGWTLHQALGLEPPPPRRRRK